MTNFLFKKSSLRFLADLIRMKFLKNFTKSALPIFIKGDDSHATTMATGYYEEYLVQFFKTKATEGLNDFFIDIGANIGLVSCQVGNEFKEVHMYEPNPLLVKILYVNSKIMLASDPKIYPFGLGSKDSNLKLTIPKKNWGGAFIDSEDNRYNAEILTQKDGYLAYDSKNYLFLDIKVNDIANEFNKLFMNLKSKGLKRGCIKIDVEGYEEVLVAGIVKMIPDDFEIILVCESWGSEIYPCLLEKDIVERLEVGRLVPRKGWIAKWNWLKVLQLVARGSYQVAYTTSKSADKDGDIVIHVTPINNC